jgi:hypothetical protein
MRVSSKTLLMKKPQDSGRVVLASITPSSPSYSCLDQGDGVWTLDNSDVVA